MNPPDESKSLNDLMAMTAIKTLTDRVERLQVRVDVLEGAIREHRDQRGDDRCWLDDITLYSYIGHLDDVALKLPTKCEFLESCSRYWENRQLPFDKVVSSNEPVQANAPIQPVDTLPTPDIDSDPAGFLEFVAARLVHHGDDSGSDLVLTLRRKAGAVREMIDRAKNANLSG